MAEIKVGQSAYSKIQQLSRVSLFNSVRVYPDRVAFDGQDEDEQIILFLRQHPIVLLPPILRSVGIILLFSAIIWAINSVVPNAGTFKTFGFVLFLGGLATAITQGIYEFFKWYYTVTLVTSSRLIDLDFKTIMDSRWSTTMLRSIQDISYNSPGFINALFDTASLRVLTASHKDFFELSNLPRARDVQDIIMDLVETEKEQNGPDEH